MSDELNFLAIKGKIKPVTLARLITPRSWAVAILREATPLLRTHLLAVLIKTL